MVLPITRWVYLLCKRVTHKEWDQRRYPAKLELKSSKTRLLPSRSDVLIEFQSGVFTGNSCAISGLKLEFLPSWYLGGKNWDSKSRVYAPKFHPVVGKLNSKVELKWSLGQLVVSSTSVCWVMYNLYCLFHYVHSWLSATVLVYFKNKTTKSNKTKKTIFKTEDLI